MNHCIKRANGKAAHPIRQRLSGPYPAIFIGGCAGTAARSWVGDLLPGGSAAWTHSSAPWATLAVNLAGAFLLGLLTAALASRFPNADPRIRLLLGTGLLGSFTTYGTFAAEVEAATPTTGAVYAAGSILCGLFWEPKPPEEHRNRIPEAATQRQPKSQWQNYRYMEQQNHQTSGQATIRPGKRHDRDRSRGRHRRCVPRKFRRSSSAQLPSAALGDLRRERRRLFPLGSGDVGPRNQRPGCSTSGDNRIFRWFHNVFNRHARRRGTDARGAQTGGSSHRSRNAHFGTAFVHRRVGLGIGPLTLFASLPGSSPHSCRRFDGVG